MQQQFKAWYTFRCSKGHTNNKEFPIRANSQEEAESIYARTEKNTECSRCDSKTPLEGTLRKIRVEPVPQRGYRCFAYYCECGELVVSKKDEVPSHNPSQNFVESVLCRCSKGHTRVLTMTEILGGMTWFEPLQ